MADDIQDQAGLISARLREASGMKSWVQPVLVFDNDVRGTFEPYGVHVVGLTQIVDYLVELPRGLDDIEVKDLACALLDDETWLSLG